MYMGIITGLYMIHDSYIIVKLYLIKDDDLLNYEIPFSTNYPIPTFLTFARTYELGVGDRVQDVKG